MNDLSLIEYLEKLKNEIDDKFYLKGSLGAEWDRAQRTGHNDAVVEIVKYIEQGIEEINQRAQGS